MELLFQIIDIVAGVLFLVFGVLYFWVGCDEYIDCKKNMPHYSMALNDFISKIGISMCGLFVGYVILFESLSLVELVSSFMEK